MFEIVSKEGRALGAAESKSHAVEISKELANALGEPVSFYDDRSKPTHRVTYTVEPIYTEQTRPRSRL